MKKLSLLCMLLPFCLFSQNIDSLNNIWNDVKQNDTTRLIALNKIAWFYAFSNPDTSRLLSDVELKMAEEKNYPKWIGNAWNTTGVSYWVEGNYPPAIECFHKSIVAWEKINFVKGLASSYHNIGLIHKAQGEKDLALSYSLKSLAYEEKIGNKRGIAESYNGIALQYNELDKNDSAMYFLNKARALWKEVDDPGITGTTCMVLGAVYYDTKNYVRSKELVDSAITYFEITGDKKSLSTCGLQLIIIYNHDAKYDEAIRAGETALVNAKEVGSLYNQKDIYITLSTSFLKKGQHEKALEYYKLGVALKDSIINDERKSEIARGEEKFIYDRKSLADSLSNAVAQQLKDAEIAENQAQLKQAQTLRYSLIGGILLLICFGIFIFNRYQLSQKQKKVISEQKAIVDQKQKEVMDSIHYARRIQRALLKDEEHTSMHLPSHFIYYLPKDIVSGDFYWAMERDNTLFLAVGDCTGHGVPGAMLTMLGTAFLNEIYSVALLPSPAQVLNQLRDKFLKELSSGTADHVAYDGMDISLVQIDLSTLKAKWAGAHNPFWYVRDSVLFETKANPQPIGFYVELNPFTEHEIQLQKGDCIYLFTDGFADQFGGPKGKKFRSKNLAELVRSIASLPAAEQRAAIVKVFEEWKGSYDQIDDVTILGMKV